MKPFPDVTILEMRLHAFFGVYVEASIVKWVFLI